MINARTALVMVQVEMNTHHIHILNIVPNGTGRIASLHRIQMNGIIVKTIRRWSVSNEIIQLRDFLNEFIEANNE